MPFLLRLRKILLSKKLYLFLIVFSFIYTTFTLTLVSRNAKYRDGKVELTAKIIQLHLSGNQFTLQLEADEKLQASYYFKTKQEKELASNFHLGDLVRVSGSLKTPTSTKNFGSFSYPLYLRQKGIYHFLQIDEMEKVRENRNVILFLRDKVRRYIASFDTVACYINCFFLGQDDDIKKDVKSAFQKLGISHLFALSGTQITFLASILLFLLQKRKQTARTIFFETFCILLCYYAMIDSCAAVDRALVFFFYFEINKAFDFFVSPFQLICISLATLLFLNPYYVLDIGFQYATVITVSLILYYEREKGKEKNFLKSLLEVSFLSFLVSLPISLYHFSYLNPLSIFYNLFYVPFINIIVFPLSIATFFCPFLKSIFAFFLLILEKSVLSLAKIPVGILIFKRLPLWYYFFLFVPIFLFLFKKKKKYFLFLLALLSFHYILPSIIKEDRLYMIDVGQGDSFLLTSNGKSMLIDTGGKMEYKQEAWEKGVEKTSLGTYTISFLYQRGIKKIDVLLLTHGDADHAMEALTLLDNIKVGSVFLNENKENSLEQQIKKKAKEKKIPVRKLYHNDTFTLSNYHFQVLSKDLNDENDSSLILYATIFQYKMLFMGDASKKSEEELLKEYELLPVTILKVGHHGSKTSSSKAFLDMVRPRYALISSGKDNKFGHPHKEVVDALKKEGSILYNTSSSGMVCFDFQKGSVKSYQKGIEKKIKAPYNEKR